MPCECDCCYYWHCVVYKAGHTTYAPNKGSKALRLTVRRRRRGDRKSEKALLKSFNAAARGSGDDSDPPVILLTSVH